MMDYPSGPIMECLGALAYADKVEDKDDTLVATYEDDDRAVVVAVHVLMALAIREWIDMDVDEHVVVTDAGVYWYGRWRTLRKKKAEGRVRNGPLAFKRPALKLRRGPGGNPVIASGGMPRRTDHGNGNHPYGTEA